MKATIKSIAQECNLSTTAVSLVLNGKPNRISEESRALILDTAKRLNYSPNQIAVGLVKGKTRTIGLILSDISNVFLAEIAKIIEEEIKKYNYTVIFGNTGDDGHRELEYIREFLGKNVDGIILLHSSDTTEEEQQTIKEVIRKSDVTFVMLDNDLEELDIARCILNNQEGGYIAVTHLLELGHRRIGSLLGPMGQCSVRDRLKGYKQALTDWDVPFDEDLLYQGDFTIQSGIAAMPYFMERNVHAVFSYNDMMAYGLYTYARDHNIKIGRDVSLIGYDDGFINNLLDVPLTSIKQPRVDMAKKATACLLKMIASGTRHMDPIVYHPELIVRKSTCPRQ